MHPALKPVGPREVNQVRGKQMPPARVSGVPEMLPRPSRPRLHVKPGLSESDGALPTARHSNIIDRSPRVSERRSPRASATDQKNVVTGSTLQKKRNNRISDLETQLGQARDELKKLREQLANTEKNTKKGSELELKQTKNQNFCISDSAADGGAQEINKMEVEIHAEKGKTFLMGKSEKSAKGNVEFPDAGHVNDADETRVDSYDKAVILIAEKVGKPLEKSESWFKDGVESLDVEMNAKLLQKQQELIRLSAENEKLKLQLLEIEELKTKEMESTKKLSQVSEELEESKQAANRVTEEFKIVVQAKSHLESEMKLLRIQTEQWRKAAEAATSILESIDDSCADTKFQNVHKQHHGFDKSYYIGFDSPPYDVTEDGYEGVHKGEGSSGVKMFGDSWKKKGQKE